ncbi:PREDICTED: follistatin-related protein 5-like isoform X1 [Diuraphis noxia]|uniref:follistatin-related protein 5-like isoform X1 n=1 Tax=Diuraphis noxia TaxID=143948 RepID=UPI0007635E50|nr:PREDICTED: follistatin-related protein 5-like isoform X1 [Diuraphis noxia]
MIRIVWPVLLLLLISITADVNAKKSRHHRLQEIHGSNTQVSVTDDGILPLPTVKPGDEYLQESEGDVEDDGDDDDDEPDDDDGDESDEEGEESAEVLEKQNPCLVHYCGRGEECAALGGVARCICVRKCGPAKRRVCGTDGRLYDNRCELHKSGCLSGVDIQIDHSLKCFIPSASKVKNVRILPKTADNAIEPETKSKEAKTCGSPQYEIMKDNLLLINHAKLMYQKSWNGGKEYMVSALFRYLDLDGDGFLQREELQKITKQDKLDDISDVCVMSDMIRFEDMDKDGRLGLNEFYAAFSKLYSLSVVTLEKALEINRISAKVGDNVEIRCDVSGNPPPPIVWKRYSADLTTLGDEDLRVFSDGSLYLTKIQLVHAGNYTCRALRNSEVTQTHVLTVHTLPEVKVTPRIQSRRPSEKTSMFCHVIGEPFPEVVWLKNEERLKLDMVHKYRVVGNGTELSIDNIDYADTGAYMCQASNTGGVTRDISSLIVQEILTPSEFAAPKEERRFFAFHDWGVSVYEPTACRLYHQIQSTDIIPGTQEYVCGDKGVNCSWGQAINVANRYVYVSQPLKDRVLVISKIQMVVVDVVITDKYPVALHYVAHLDQVWVLNWRSVYDDGVKTIQVIRDASQKRKHHTVHPEPIDGQFDLVRNLFMPTAQDLSHWFKYGYVSHSNQRGLYKLDLANMRYIRSIDLSPYNCVPRNLQFSSLYGFVIIECEEPGTGHATGQVILDYLTDTVVNKKASVRGSPLVSPDSRVVVSIDKAADGITLVVQQVLESGLKFSFDVKTTLMISDIAFYPSRTTHGYDLYASAADKEDILFLNLSNGKVEMITGVGKAMLQSLTQWGNPNRPIAASGIFGHYMVTPADEALFVINGETRTVNCEIGGLVHPRLVTWVTMQLQ